MTNHQWKMENGKTDDPSEFLCWHLLGKGIVPLLGADGQIRQAAGRVDAHPDLAPPAVALQAGRDIADAVLVAQLKGDPRRRVLQLRPRAWEEGFAACDLGDLFQDRL